MKKCPISTNAFLRKSWSRGLEELESVRLKVGGSKDAAEYGLARGDFARRTTNYILHITYVV